MQHARGNDTDDAQGTRSLPKHTSLCGRKGGGNAFAKPSKTHVAWFWFAAGPSKAPSALRKLKIPWRIFFEASSTPSPSAALSAASRDRALASPLGFQAPVSVGFGFRVKGL